MSRSRRKNPAGGTSTARSEKSDKQKAHRRFRRLEHAAIQCGKQDAAPVSTRLTFDRWTAAKDGKTWYGNSPRCAYLLRK